MCDYVTCLYEHVVCFYHICVKPYSIQDVAHAVLTSLVDRVY